MPFWVFFPFLSPSFSLLPALPCPALPPSLLSLLLARLHSLGAILLLPVSLSFLLALLSVFLLFSRLMSSASPYLGSQRPDHSHHLIIPNSGYPNLQGMCSGLPLIFPLPLPKPRHLTPVTPVTAPVSPPSLLDLLFHLITSITLPFLPSSLNHLISCKCRNLDWIRKVAGFPRSPTPSHFPTTFIPT